MQDRNFTEALLHVEHRICGRRLRPYCIAYAAALQGMRSPLVSDDPQAQITPADLLYALEVCSSPVDPATLCPRAVLRPRFRWLDHCRLVLWRFHPAGYVRALEKWLAYYRDYYSPPQLMERVSEGAKCHQGGHLTGPTELANITGLLTKFPGLSEHRAWTMPYGLAVWMLAQAGEIEGGPSFWNAEREAELDAALDEAERKGAELLKARKGKR